MTPKSVTYVRSKKNVRHVGRGVTLNSLKLAKRNNTDFFNFLGKNWSAFWKFSSIGVHEPTPIIYSVRGSRIPSLKDKDFQNRFEKISIMRVISKVRTFSKARPHFSKIWNGFNFLPEKFLLRTAKNQYYFFPLTLNSFELIVLESGRS